MSCIHNPNKHSSRCTGSQISQWLCLEEFSSAMPQQTAFRAVVWRHMQVLPVVFCNCGRKKEGGPATFTTEQHKAHIDSPCCTIRKIHSVPPEGIWDIVFDQQIWLTGRWSCQRPCRALRPPLSIPQSSIVALKARGQGSTSCKQPQPRRIIAMRVDGRIVLGVPENLTVQLVGMDPAPVGF